MNFYIGIDQTGASASNGLARALPFAFLDARAVTNGSRPRLRTLGLNGRALKLETFSFDAISRLLTHEGVTGVDELMRSPETALLVDCVFGLPADLGLTPGADTFRSLFAKAAAHPGGYGMDPAASFFDEIKGSRDGYPVRECEKLANANSVFRTQPYQRNIQCGTYRVWRDLGLHGSEWLHLRYFEKTRATKPVLLEAYPSLIWRDFLNLRSRDRTLLTKAIKAHPVAIVEKDLRLMIDNADHADAGVLALGGYLADQASPLTPTLSKNRKLAREGWILALKRPL